MEACTRFENNGLPFNVVYVENLAQKWSFVLIMGSSGLFRQTCRCADIEIKGFEKNI